MLRRSTLVPLLATVAIGALGACVDDEPDLATDDEVAALSAHDDKLATNGFPSNPLDGPRPTQGVARMESSQLSRLSVGRWWSGSFASPGVHHAVFRTACASWDTAMYVVRRQSCTGTPLQCAMWKPIKDARFNDDCTGTGCVARRNSKIDMGAQTSGTHTYDVYLFSNAGGAFGCTLQRSLDGGTTWSSLASNVTVGGQLVDVGAVNRGANALDTFEVKTLQNEGVAGPASSDTQAMLFDVGTASPLSATGTYESAMVPVWNDGVAGVDIDPKIGPAITSTTPDRPPVTCNEPCTPPAMPRHFLAIGTNPTQGALELTLDVVRTPANAAQSSASFALVTRNGWRCSSGTIPLESGRYQAFTDVVAREPYAMGDINPACELLGTDCATKPFFRGRGNALAFRMKLQTLANLTWVDVPGSQRDVPLGSFGSAAPERKIVDFEVSAPAGTSKTYSLCVSAIDPSIVFASGQWSARKNPRFSELKVASLNLLRWDNSENEDRNVANLLLTRGRMSSIGSVYEADRAPFEWNADIVAFQEQWSSDYDFMADEAEAQSSLRWHYVFGDSKYQTSTYNRQSGLLAHDHVISGGTLEPARDASNADWRCTHEADSAPHADAEVHCYNRDSEDGWGDYWTWSIPGKTRVRRWNAEGTPDQPIMVYNVQFEPDKFNVDNRERELDSLIATIKQQLAFSPQQFNNGGSQATGPGHAGNRIILVGDFNTFNHDFGENRWMLERLREEFGWAIDAAAADQNSFANFYDMHELQGSGMSSEAPFAPNQYTSTVDWRDLSSTPRDPLTWWWNTPAFGTTFGDDRFYPYWARTNRGATGDQDSSDAGGERNDMILLVGRGWHLDDPIRNYVVMNTTTEGDSPFAMHDANGNVLAVDTWFSYSDTDFDVPGSQSHPTSVPHYRPLRTASSFDDNCTARGCAAFQTDHIPIGARIRVGE